MTDQPKPSGAARDEYLARIHRVKDHIERPIGSMSGLRAARRSGGEHNARSVNRRRG